MTDEEIKKDAQIRVIKEYYETKENQAPTDDDKQEKFYEALKELKENDGR